MRLSIRRKWLKRQRERKMLREAAKKALHFEPKYRIGLPVAQLVNDFVDAYVDQQPTEALRVLVVEPPRKPDLPPPSSRYEQAFQEAARVVRGFVPKPGSDIDNVLYACDEYVRVVKLFEEHEQSTLNGDVSKAVIEIMRKSKLSPSVLAAMLAEEKHEVFQRVAEKGAEDEEPAQFTPVHKTRSEPGGSKIRVFPPIIETEPLQLSVEVLDALFPGGDESTELEKSVEHLPPEERNEALAMILSKDLDEEEANAAVAEADEDAAEAVAMAEADLDEPAVRLPEGEDEDAVDVDDEDEPLPPEPSEEPEPPKTPPSPVLKELQRAVKRAAIRDEVEEKKRVPPPPKISYPKAPAGTKCATCSEDAVHHVGMHNYCEKCAPVTMKRRSKKP